LTFATLATAIPVEARTLTVDRTDDVVASTCDDAVPNDCSLRGAITAANAESGDTIRLPAGTYTLTIPSTAFEDANANGDLDITASLTLIGDGAATAIIQACAPVPPATTCVGIDRVLDIDPGRKGINVQISGVTIRNGNMAAFADTRGGGIRNRGTLTIADSVISGNASGFPGAVGFGGGIMNERPGTLTLVNTTVSDNTTTSFGGGISNDDEATLILIKSTVSFNKSSQDGGGIHSGFFDINKPSNTKVVISGSTISNNSTGAQGGGGIARLRGTLTLTDSTVSGNTSVSGGGGIFSAAFDNGPNRLTNCTISGNFGITGGGIESGSGPLILANCTIAGNSVTSLVGSVTSHGGGTSGPLSLANTIIAGNSADSGQGPDCAGSVTSNGHNLIQNPDNCALTGDTTSNLIGIDPRLGLLTDNGGPTPTQALLAGSPAIDKGSPGQPGSGGSNCPAVDQRGFPRPVGTACDIGAFESRGGLLVLGMVPKSGGNRGRLVTVVSGNGFATNATIKLVRAGESDIVGVPVSVQQAGSALGTSFDLTGQRAGSWDVVITNPDGTSANLAGGFSIEDPRAPDLWSSVVARSIARPGRPATFTIMYGNRGNVDTFAVPLTLNVPGNFPLSVLFQISPPLPQPGQVQTDWSTVPVAVRPFAQNGFLNVPLILPIVPAGFTGILEVTLMVPPNLGEGDVFELLALMGTPYLHPDPDPQVIHDFSAGARDYAEHNLGVTIPSTLLPQLNSYITTQLLNILVSGQEALMSSLGTHPQIYSLAQIVIDLARFGAALTTQAQSLAGVRPFPLSAPGKTPPKPGCDPSAVLPLGSTGCKEDPTPIPNPDNPPGGLTPGECRDQPNHQVSAGGTLCVPKDKTTCAKFSNPLVGSDPLCATIPIRQSIDPNDKSGAQGVTPQRFLVAGTPLLYTVFFENLATASVPAQEVVITDQLDPTKVDLSTFSLGSISFGNIGVRPPPGQSHYIGGVDLRPAQNLIVEVNADLNNDTGLLTWRFTSVDPDTLTVTTDPSAGFLPPNLSPPQGQGSVLFSVNPKPTLQPGLRSGTRRRSYSISVHRSLHPSG